MSTMTKLLSLIFIMGAMVSCGDLFHKEEEKKEEFNQFVTCEFEPKSLSKIMTENIKGDISCLEDYLQLFIRVVRSDQPGYLESDKLKKYIDTNLDDVDPEILEAIDSIFMLNSLLFGDKEKSIHKKNVSKLTAALKEFNHIVIQSKMYKYFTVEERVTFTEHNRRKAEIFRAFKKIGELFNDAIVDNNNKINLVAFIDHFKNIDEDNDIIKYIRSTLFLKKAFLGGEEEILTAKELKRLTRIMGSVGKVAYDFVNLPDTNTEAHQEEEVLKILKEDIQTAQNLFYYKDVEDEPIVTYNQIKTVVDIFFPDFSIFVEYKTSFTKAKEVIFGSSSDVFTSSEVNFLLKDILYKNISRGAFIYRSYSDENNKSILNSIERIWDDFTSLATFSSDERSFEDDFNRISKDYRYFQGSSYIPLFGFEFARNPRGFFEISIFEDIVKRFFVYYGSIQHEVKGDYVMTLEQLQQFMVDFSEIFIGEDYILPGRAADTAETIILMTSLFHSQSNGDGFIEIPEFVEFIVTMLSSLTLSNDTEKFMLTSCEVDEKQRISPECFRKSFISFLDHKVSDDKQVHEFLPNLRDYLASLPEEDGIEEYITATTAFARTCNFFDDGTEVPMKFGDYIVTWGGLLSIEQSMIKFDLNESGVLEYREVEDAYDVYKSAVEGMIPVDFLKKYSKYFFKYIVKFKEVPEVPSFDPEQKIRGNWFVRTFRSIKARWKQLAGMTKAGGKFLKFMFDVKFRDMDKEIVADRMTFASVLRIIGENSPSTLENPYPCETLR